MFPNKGVVYIVGAGPGDPRLMTVRAVELLKNADAIVYDKLIPQGVLGYAKSDAELYDVGKEGGKHHISQEEINSLLCRLAEEGKMVVRLKGGDPFIFGRGSEEALELRKKGLKFEIVSGITSGVAVPAYAGIPLTHRGIATSVHFITGHEDPTKSSSQINFDALAKVEGTLVFFMGVSNLSLIAEKLIASGKSPNTPCAVIQWGCTPHQRTVTGTLSEIARIAEENGIRPPSIICIGDVCLLRDELNWFENAPLFGKSVVITRTREQASELASKLLSLGAEVIEFPTIRIEYTTLSTENLEKLKNLSVFNWIIFTSQNAVPPFFKTLSDLNLDSRALAGVRIAAIGDSTAKALREKGIMPDLVPQTFTSSGLLDAFSKMDESNRGKKVLLPRSNIASRELPDGLLRMGMDVSEIEIYQTKSALIDHGKLNRIVEGKVDYITFASSSSVENFLNVVGHNNFINLSLKSRFISIGPVTSSTIIKVGATVRREASKNNIDGLVEAIIMDAGVNEG